MQTIKIYLSDCTNPWFNLATEDWLFQELDDFDHVLFLWRNKDTVVIGRTQNPWAECHLDQMKTDHVKLARRQSGGGAVFHDLGNTNFTFLSKKPHYDKNISMQIIVNALQNLGLDAQISGRNDIVLARKDNDIRKISGNAFKEKTDRAFHHGTLLIDTKLDRLINYLNPSKKKLKAKGKKSVRCRVMNCAERIPGLDHKSVCDAIIEAFQEHHGMEIKPEWLDILTLEDSESLQEHYQQLQAWDWLYGQTLEFTHHLEERFDWGCVEFQIQVNNGMIDDLRVYSDCLYPDFIDTIIKNCKGINYHPDTMQQVITQAAQKNPQLMTASQDLVNWLKTSIEDTEMAG